MTLVMGKSSRGKGPLAQKFRFSKTTLRRYLMDAQNGYSTERPFSWDEGHLWRNCILLIDRLSLCCSGIPQIYYKTPLGHPTISPSSGSLIAYGAWKYRSSDLLEPSQCRRMRTRPAANLRRRHPRLKKTPASSSLVMANQRRRRARAPALQARTGLKEKALLDRPRTVPRSLTRGR